jgi:dipeptidyl aminopeptidase/acylaminoacyl peptidase
VNYSLFKSYFARVGLVLWAAVMPIASGAQQQDVGPASIPVLDFFRPPQFTQFSISPDGKHLAALAPLNGRRNLIIIDLQTRKSRAITSLKEYDVYFYRWLSNSLIEFSTTKLEEASGQQQIESRVVIHIHEGWVRSTEGWGRLLTQVEEGNEVRLIMSSFGRSIWTADAYSVNPRDGVHKLLTYETPGDVVRFVSDHAGHVRFASSVHDDGKRNALYYRPNNESKWTKLSEHAYGERGIYPINFDRDNRLAYVFAPAGKGGDKDGVYLFDPVSNKIVSLVFESERIDASCLILDQVERTPLSVCDKSKDGVRWLDRRWEAIQKAVNQALPKTSNILTWASKSRDKFIVSASSELQPSEYYLLDRETMRMEQLESSRPWIKPEQMSVRKLVRYTARDGLEIPAFLTIPRGSSGKNLPLVIDIHGGPFVDGHSSGFDEDAQFLASRGYAVLQPQFRGTTGLGDKHYKAGWKQYGRGMQDDLTDGAKWLIDQGIADRSRICLMGGSYGGYAAAWGMMREPELYRCGIAFVALTDLELKFDVVWSDYMSSSRAERYVHYMHQVVGDPQTQREWMREVSPLHQAHRLQGPLLLAFGAADSRVPLVHGQKLRSALDKHGKTYEWVVYNDEGHGFNKPENIVDFYTRVERFLAKHIGGKTTDAVSDAPQASAK